MARSRKGGRAFVSGPSTTRASFDGSWVTRTGDHTAPLSDRISGGGLPSENVETRMSEQKGVGRNKSPMPKGEQNMSGLVGTNKTGRTGTKSPTKAKDPITDQVKQTLKRGR